MPDLNDIALFVQVVRSGSFAEAARRTGIPPNTVSRRVQQLETELGTRLMQRSTRKLTLTTAGRAFHERCSGSVDGLVEAGQSMIAGSREPGGLVRVAAPADFFEFFEIDWVTEFLRTYPRVRLDFMLSDAKADLIDDQIDIAFRGGDLGDLGFIGRQLSNSRHTALVASPAYIKARGMPNSLRELVNHDCVTPSHPSSLTTWRMNGPNGLEEVQVNGRFSGNTAQALRRATVAGLGIALLPPVIIGREIRAKRLVPVLTQYQHSSQGMLVLYPSRRHVPLAVSAFIDFASEKITEIERLIS